MDSSVLHPLTSFATPVVIKPLQQVAYTGHGQRDRTIRGPVVEINGVSVSTYCVSAWEHDIVHVAVALVFRLRTKDPGISPQQALLWTLEVEERQP